MKQIPILFFLSLNFIAVCQPFGALGTEWEHCIIPTLEFPISYDKVVVKSVDSFSMNGLECNELEILYKPNTVRTHTHISICRDEDKVFYVEGDSLHLVYDFSLEAGEEYMVRYPILFDTTYQYYFPNESIYTFVTVDSVKIVNINGVELRKQFISTQSSLIKYGKYALEKVGYEAWILPFFSFDAFDTNIFRGLLSFEDDVLEIIDSSSQCLVSSISNIDHNHQVEIFPNPASSNEVIILNGFHAEFIENI